MSTVPERPSTSIEDYLKVIYDLQERGSGRVTISRIAERMTVSSSSVSGMLRKLAETGLVEHARYSDVHLTEPGEKAALSVLRRHRLIEAYLVEALGYAWDEVHDEAEVLEHVVSDRFVDRIADYLGNPTTDPHGDPIPTREGHVVAHATHQLSDAPVGTIGSIVRVNDTDPELLRYLTDQDLALGMHLEVVERQPFGGPLIVRVRNGSEDRHQSLGDVAAAALWIRADH